MKRFLTSIVSLTLLATTVVPAFAQTATPSSTSSTRKIEAQQRRDAALQKAAEIRAMQASKAAEMRAMQASKAAELKARLAAFKDQQKATLVEKINTTLAMINQKQTDAMKRHLAKMTELLTKLTDRVAAKKTAGKDTTAADAAIASASASVASASTAVDAQALKDYTIAVSSESAVRADAKVSRDKLHADLQAARKLVIEAKRSIANAIRIAATTLGGIGDGK